MSAMNIQTSNTGFMPRNVAIALLTSNQSKTNGFRKRCFRAMERVCTPLSRSTALPVSALKTGAQRLQARLVKASAAQLHRWHKRTLRRGNRLQDQRDNVFFEVGINDEEKEKIDTMLQQQTASHDGLCQAIIDQLTNRAARGKGYKKPLKYRKI